MESILENPAASISTAETSSPAYQAYRILHVTFSVVPIVTGLDKFFPLALQLGSVPGPRDREALADWRSQSDVCDRRGGNHRRLGCRVQTEIWRLSCRIVAMGHHHQFVNDPTFLRRCFP